MLKLCDLSFATERILDAGRWAPSGDNAQPWRFEVRNNDDLIIHIRREPGNVYEYRDGEPTLLSAGALLENMAVAATNFGKTVKWRYQGPEAGEHRVQVEVIDSPRVSPDPLFSQIYQRSVDRRPYRMERLSVDKKRLLNKAVGDTVSVQWFETLGARWKIAALTATATNIRLRIPETFAIHRQIVDWGNPLSPAGIPSGALGVDSLTLKAMRWLLANQKRTDFANRFGSNAIAALQMDTIPGIFSSAYVGFRLSGPYAGPKERVSQLLRAGQSAQRFWLTATKLGLAMQPCLAVLAFIHYGSVGAAFTVSERARRLAVNLALSGQRVLAHSEELVFLARIGSPNIRKLESRSTRLPLRSLLISN